MGQLISINLDPTKDGIVGKIDRLEATSGRYVVIGTNGEYRFISGKQFDSYTDELLAGDRAGLMMIKDFMLYYDKEKIINVEDGEFLIGSFMLVELATDGSGGFCRMGEGDIEYIKECLSDYCADLIIDGERYSALCID